jgi:hypothetical protein
MDRVLLEVRQRLVEHYRAIAINDANVCRIVTFIVDPLLGRQQHTFIGLCAKGTRVPRSQFRRFFRFSNLAIGLLSNRWSA